MEWERRVVVIDDFSTNAGIFVFDLRSAFLELEGYIYLDNLMYHI